MNRRRLLLAGLAGAALSARAQKFQPPQDITPLLMQVTGGAAPVESGVEIVLPQIAENGNSVPLRVRVASPMTPEDHVKAIHIFAERNPRPLVATFHLGPQSGRAEITTRVRLAGTQKVRALAELSGNRFVLGSADVLVTAAACLDESLL
ncbi:MAG: thiosulfate oxidation carrier protein SoxY [Usitatibacter sp.]